MNGNSDFLLLFASCFPVKGASRSLIVDSARSQLFFIGNDHYEILQEAKKRKWTDILDEYDEESQSQLNGLAGFLEKNQLSHWTDEPERFPDIDLRWDAPSVITNAIIDSDASSSHDWRQIFGQLIEVGCRDIQLRFYDETDLDLVDNIMSMLAGSYIKSVEFLLRHRPEYTRKYLTGLVEKYIRVKSLIIHSSPKDQILRHHNYRNYGQMGNVVLIRQVIGSSAHCGFVTKDYFVYSNVQTFAEFRNYNSCLNRKIGIDVQGNIRNCPALPRIYGNIGRDRIGDLITDEFREVWGVSKDQIDTCKVCEFRYVCPDCRAFVKEPFSKPLKCNYDPYTMEWK